MAINERVKELSGKIQASMEMDTTNKVVVTKDDTYESCLPEGLTMPIVNQVSEYNTDFVAASAHAFGAIAVKAMASDKTIDQLFTTTGMGGKDAVHHTIARVKEFRNPQDADTPIIKYGAMTTTFEVKAGSNGGQLKAARNDIAALAAAAFK
jgi:hypothetical protein